MTSKRNFQILTWGVAASALAILALFLIWVTIHEYQVRVELESRFLLSKVYFIEHQVKRYLSELELQNHSVNGKNNLQNDQLDSILSKYMESYSPQGLEDGSKSTMGLVNVSGRVIYQLPIRAKQDFDSIPSIQRFFRTPEEIVFFS